MRISVVIPVYNSEKILPSLVSQLKPVLESLASEFELILVNDGSRDRSWHLICELSAQNNWIRGIDLYRNFGQHNALLCGIQEAKFEVTVTMDDDLQHPPEELPRLVNKLSEGYDLVYGIRQEEQHGLLRNIASRSIKFALRKVMGVKLAHQISPFRAFKTRLRDAFSSFKSPFVSIDALLSWGTTVFSSVHVSHHPRQSGRSSYTFLGLMNYASNIMTSFSTFPLRLASLVGFIAIFFGVCMFGVVLIRYLIEGSIIPGFPFLASIISILCGTQLFLLAIIGEYIANIHFRTMGKPTYLIRSYSEGKADQNAFERGHLHDREEVQS